MAALPVPVVPASWMTPLETEEKKQIKLTWDQKHSHIADFLRRHGLVPPTLVALVPDLYTRTARHYFALIKTRETAVADSDDSDAEENQLSDCMPLTEAVNVLREELWTIKNAAENQPFFADEGLKETTRDLAEVELGHLDDDEGHVEAAFARCCENWQSAEIARMRPVMVNYWKKHRKVNDVEDFLSELLVQQHPVTGLLQEDFDHKDHELRKLAWPLLQAYLADLVAPEQRAGPGELSK